MDPADRPAPDRRRDLFGGRGEVRVWSLLRAPAPPFTAALRCELDPGGRVGRHVQQAFPELVIGVAGVGEAIVGGVRHPLAAGDLVYLPLGEILEIHNLSGEVALEYLIIKARGDGR